MTRPARGRRRPAVVACGWSAAALLLLLALAACVLCCSLPAHALSASASSEDDVDSPYAFLSSGLSATDSASSSNDVEAQLDSIAGEVESVLPQASSHSHRHARKQQKRRRAARKSSPSSSLERSNDDGDVDSRPQSRAHSRSSAGSPSTSSASSRLRRLSRVVRTDDSYHAKARSDPRRDREGGEDWAGLLESASSSSTRSGVQARAAARGWGYSLPSGYVGGGPLPPQQAIQSPYAPATLVPAGWNLGVPQQPQSAPAPAALASNAATVGLLIRALRKVREEEEAQQQLAAQVGLAMAAAQGQQPQPQLVPSPFNYPPLVAAPPVGVVQNNPNFFPYAPAPAPLLLPGQVPGQSPSYPSFIPPEQAHVGLPDAQQVDLGH